MTTIEWTDETWNPVTGCSKISEGCRHCYAETVAQRFWGARDFTDVQIHPDRLDQPLHWRKPRRVFVNSMSDLFHEDVPWSFLDQVFRVMLKARQHTFQALTKRPARMLGYFAPFKPDGEGYVTRDGSRAMGKPVSGPIFSDNRWPAPHIWLGVSVENQQTADERIPLLLQTPAAVRWVSVEPLLGPVDLRAVRWGHASSLCGLDWVVVGGESGPGARPCHVDWIRSIKEQCLAAGVLVFVKQLGAQPVGIARLRDRKGGDMAEWPEDLRVREWPQ